jgi:prepilin-type N-terminal cleavage/methylation domain-containing protein
MRNRQGFTLLELMLAVVVTSVVALLVYGTVQVGLDARERLAERLVTDQSHRAVRVILRDALRNVRHPVGVDDSVFVLRRGMSTAGRPADTLSFLTGGSIPPLTSDSDWMVSLAASDSGLTMWARPVGTRLPARLVASLPGVLGLEVRVRRVGADSSWTADWPVQRVLPAAVAVTFWSDSGPLAPTLRAAIVAGGAQ